MQRREFLKLSTALVASGATANLSEALRTDETVGSNARTPADELRFNIARLRKLDDHLGGADTYKLYIAEVDKTLALLKNRSHAIAARAELLRLLSEQQQQAGWAAFDAGWHETAKKLYEQAFTAARESNSPDLAGNALAFRAYQVVSTGGDGTGITDRSLAIGAADAGMRVLLPQRGAWTYAVAGQPERTARLLDQAERAIHESQGEDTPGWAAWASDVVEQEIITGRCWAELRRPLRAVPALESAMRRYDDSHARDKALYLSSLADAYVDAAEPEQAAAVAGRALTLATDVASVRPMHRIRAVANRLDGTSDAEPVKDLPVKDLLARCAAHPV